MLFFYLTAATTGHFLFLVASAFFVSANSPISSHSRHSSIEAAAVKNIGSESCSSNSSHIGWICDDGEESHQPMDEARTKMMEYLWKNIMPYDVPNARTLGFDSSFLTLPAASLYEDSEAGRKENDGHRPSSILRAMRTQAKVDGLSNGILNQTLHYSLRAKALYPWTDFIPRSIYMEYVVPYAVVNEPRSDHRPLLFNALRDTMKDYERPKENHGSKQEPVQTQKQTTNPQMQIKQVVKLVNSRLWATLGRNSSTPIVFQAGLTPRIYDPLSVIAYGHSSCTGLAILLIAALRSVGIPARMAGTPAWYGKEEEGNHSWVEVFIPGLENEGGGWVFLEPSPGIAEGDEKTANADDLERDACERWFCNAARFNGSTKVFATRYSRDTSNTHYPMAWAVGEEGVPGMDRSDYYTKVCGNCGN